MVNFYFLLLHNWSILVKSEHEINKEENETSGLELKIVMNINKTIVILINQDLI